MYVSHPLHWTGGTVRISPLIKANHKPTGSTGASALRQALAQVLVTVRLGISAIRFLERVGPVMNVPLMHRCLALASALTPARMVRLATCHRCWLPCPA